MRFLRGIGMGMLSFIVWVIASTMAAFQLLGEYGLSAEVDLTRVSPIFLIPMILGFVGMFVGPLYYWVVEPIRERGELRPARLQQMAPHVPYKTQMSPTSSHPRPVQATYKFCANCGKENEIQQRFCAQCGSNLEFS